MGICEDSQGGLINVKTKVLIGYELQKILRLRLSFHFFRKIRVGGQRGFGSGLSTGT